MTFLIIYFDCISFEYVSVLNPKEYENPQTRCSHTVEFKINPSCNLQGFIQERIGSENGPFTKIGDLKTNPSQKQETLKRIQKLKIIM